jgi:hypothetical protein
LLASIDGTRNRNVAFNVQILIVDGQAEASFLLSQQLAPVVPTITPVVPTSTPGYRTGSTLGLTRALVQVALALTALA